MDGSVLDTYGGEFEWDRWDVHLWKARGNDNGVRITYGKNLTGLDWDTDVSDTYTSAIAYWKQEEDSAITYVSSDIQSVGTNTFAFQRTIAVDATSEFQSQPTVAQLNSYAQSYVKSNALAPTVSVKADFVPLW
jgi:phage minor structural protein